MLFVAWVEFAEDEGGQQLQLQEGTVCFCSRISLFVIIAGLGLPLVSVFFFCFFCLFFCSSGYGLNKQQTVLFQGVSSLAQPEIWAFD